ncbi:fused MFS/spermidine synthase [Pseudomonadota bacterium]
MSPAHACKITVMLVMLLFFFSGAVALTYQVVWGRMMMHIFGSTALAVGTVLAGFMSGLAAGGWLGGRLADRVPNGLRLYAWLELGIAVAALLAQLLLHRMETLYPALYALMGASPLVAAAGRFILVFVLVLAPTALMGATLPVLTRFMVSRPGTLGSRLSSLYAVNTLGAVCGALVTGFYLIGRYGMHMPIYAAVAGNALIGTIALAASLRHSLPAPVSAPIPSQHSLAGSAHADPHIVRLIVLGLGVSGFTSFAYEIYWTRSLVFILGNSTYAMTTMLCAFLSGIALGGFGVRFLLHGVRNRVALFGWIQILLGISSAVALPTLFSVVEPRAVGQLLVDASAQPLPLLLSGFSMAFGLMLIPAVLIGMTFPLAGEIAAPEPRRTGTVVGRVYAINTLGNVLGALLPAVVLLGWLGIQRGILAMASLNIVLGAIVLAAKPLQQHWRSGSQFVLPVALIAALALASRVPVDFQFPSESELGHHRTLFYREGPLATTKVFDDPLTHEKFMSVDGIIIGGTGNTEFKQLLLAHLPKLLLDDVSTELSVGVGSGMLAGESLLHARVRQITGVEIEPGVIAGAAWFHQENHAVLQNPRLRIVADDIGNFLRTTSDRYQVISADEKTADEYASNGFSYSRDYYELLLSHLAADGLVAQWVPTTLPPSQYRMILKTFADVFPHVQLWHFLPAWKRGPFNTILIGSHRAIPIEPLRIEERIHSERAAFASLERYGVTSAEALLPHFIASDELLRQAVEDAEINSLDHPRYEFYRPWDYARDRAEKVIANYDLLMELKRQAFPGYLAALTGLVPDMARLRQSLAAEFRYLIGFRKFLTGMPLEENYRIFDAALATAPWNDSLRARIYVQYSYLASTRRDPAERAILMQRAEALYPDQDR